MNKKIDSQINKFLYELDEEIINDSRIINPDNLHLYKATRKKRGNILRINNIESAADSLFRAKEFIDKSDLNKFYWKWIIICLQNSLYTFALTVAAGSNSKAVLRKDGKVIDFFPALRMCHGFSTYIYSKPLILTKKQINSLLFLHDHFRNGFEHFAPTSWLIVLQGIPNICIDCLDVIQFLAIQGKQITHEYTKSKRDKIIRSINSSKKTLIKSRFYKEDSKLKEHQRLKRVLNQFGIQYKET